MFFGGLIWWIVVGFPFGGLIGSVVVAFVGSVILIYIARLPKKA